MTDSFVVARRHPHQVFVAGFAMLAGIPTLVGGPSPDSLAAAMPTLLVYVWAGVLAVGGAVVVLAAAVRSPVTGLYLEAVAHLPLCLMALAYVVALLGLAGWTALSASLLVGGFAVASAFRFVQVTRSLATLRRAVGRPRESPSCGS